MRHCNCTAATATWPTTASKGSCATCACTRYWRGRTRSCGSSWAAASRGRDTVVDPSPHSEVLVGRRGALGRLTLNRPRAINALNHSMVRTLAAALDEWRSDDSVRTVLLSGAGDRGLCAGGDIVAIYRAVASGRDDAVRFWADEYRLDA